jgi:hypothetical protein
MGTGASLDEPAREDGSSPWAAPLAIGLSGLVLTPWLLRRKR